VERAAETARPYLERTTEDARAAAGGWAPMSELDGRGTVEHPVVVHI
jgi:hypothetical protein